MDMNVQRFRCFSATCLVAGAVLLGLPVSAQSLDEGLRLFKNRSYPEAAVALYDVLLNDVNPDSRDQAEIYLAETLRKMDLLVPALFYYQDIFNAGRANRYYLNAVEGLLEVQKSLRDPVLVPIMLDQNFDREGFGRLSDDKIAAVNAMIGEFSLRREKNEDAKAFLRSVAPSSRYYPKARYLLAVLSVRQGDSDGAMQHFQAVLDHIPENTSDAEAERVRHLAQLGVARVYYGQGRYDESSAEYAKVPRFSELWFYALYEDAWAQFRQEEYGRALGALQSVTSPFFAKRHVPEAYVIAGTAYFVNCQWDRVRREVERFKSVYEPITTQLQAYLKEEREPGDYYRDIVSGGAGRYSIELAREVRRRDRFLDYHHMLSHMSWELAAISKVKTWQSSRLGADLTAIVQAQQAQLEPVVGNWVRSRLQFLAAQLQHFQNQINILDFEVTDAERQWLEQGKEILKGRRARLPRPEIPNDQWQHWNFHKEYWKDELGYFQHSLRSECF